MTAERFRSSQPTAAAGTEELKGDSEPPRAVLRDEIRPVTALFADIVGSTALGEFLAMEEVKALVGECVTRMSEAIERFGGTVGAFMGDGVASFFGMEVAREDDQLRAALAALEVRRVVAEYAQEAQSAWGVENLDVRIGINTGRVATGPIGGNRPQVLALGDAVNVAARLQAVAEPGSIVVGGSVRKALAGRFQMERIGHIELKGRVKRVEAFVLMAETPSAPNDAQGSFIGRSAELAQFEAVLTELSSGRGQIALILGEPGIGKTRLLDEVRRRAASQILWLGANCGSIEARLPYEPFVEALRLWLGLEIGAPDLAVRVRLRAKLKDLLGDEGEELVAPLGRLLGVRPRTKNDSRLDGFPVEVQTANLHAAYKRWVTELARSVPLVLAVDNFERVDEGTAELGQELLSVTDVAPLLVVIAMRSAPGAKGWNLRVNALSEFAHRADELRLKPLSSNESKAVVAALDTHVAVGTDVASTLVARAEGNPLYLEELFNAVAGDTSTGTQVLHDESVLPPVLESLLLARIDSLPRPARELLQAAAVLGREFSKEALTYMHPIAALDGNLTTLLRADMIRERRRDPAEYSFKHGLLRDAALSTLTKQRRRVLHGRAAIAVEATCGLEVRDRVASLAWHHLASGENERALMLLEDLGERFASVHRLDEAIQILETCRAKMGDHNRGRYLRIGRRLSELRAGTGDIEGAVALIEELVRKASDPAERLDLLALKGDLLTGAGQLADAGAVLQKCLARADAGPERQRILSRMAQLSLRRQDLQEARRFLDQLDDNIPYDVELSIEIASVWAGYLAATGDFIAARTWGVQAEGLARSLGRASIELKTQRQLGVLQLLNGRVGAGFALLKEAFDRASEIGFTRGVLESGVNLVHAAYLLGELAVSEDVSRRMLDLNDAAFWEGFVKSNLAAIRFERNDFEAAEEMAHRVLSLGVQVTSPAPRIAARSVIAKVRRAEGEWESAEEELQLAMAEARLLGGRSGLLGSLRTELGELALARGDWQQALVEADAANDGLQFVEKPMHVAPRRLKGMATVRSDIEMGRSILNDVRNMCRVMEMKLEEARTLVAIGACSPSMSEAVFAQAREIFNACGCERGLIELSQARADSMQS